MNITLADILDEVEDLEEIEREEEFEPVDESDIIDVREELENEAVRIQKEQQILAEREAQMKETTNLAKNMKKYEKEALVKGIPINILQNEISRRIKEKYEAIDAIKQIVESLGEY